ncbi:MAG: helix-turn-helix domain-containing protein [Planctomycetes bacterium]|nr:helix-turn-helix domain-containing protein [Planctomycetota bacterium]MBM4087755.1 helix-turn-helix domain-containing protein [Planctomycetota bacterium]
MSEWLTIQEAAAHLKVSKPTIYRWMRSGALTFYKMGSSTRFRRDQMDAVAQKMTGQAEAQEVRRKCSVCGNTEFVSGRVRSTGLMYFQPEKTKFLVATDSFVSVEAVACTACGNVDLFADPEKLARLKPKES